MKSLCGVNPEGMLRKRPQSSNKHELLIQI
jgi:hypothetical protein